MREYLLDIFSQYPNAAIIISLLASIVVAALAVAIHTTLLSHHSIT